MKKYNISSDMAKVIGIYIYIYIETIKQILKEREETRNDN